LTTPATQLTAGDIDNDGVDDLIGVWGNSIWVRNGKTKQWYVIPTTSKPTWITMGITANAAQAACAEDDMTGPGIDLIDPSETGPGDPTADIVVLDDDDPASDIRR
jgi:hypothetical protein